MIIILLWIISLYRYLVTHSGRFFVKGLDSTIASVSSVSSP